MFSSSPSSCAATPRSMKAEESPQSCWMSYGGHLCGCRSRMSHPRSLFVEWVVANSPIPAGLTRDPPFLLLLGHIGVQWDAGSAVQIGPSGFWLRARRARSNVGVRVVGEDRPHVRGESGRGTPLSAGEPWLRKTLQPVGQSTITRRGTAGKTNFRCSNDGTFQQRRKLQCRFGRAARPPSLARLASHASSESQTALFPPAFCSRVVFVHVYLAPIAWTQYNDSVTVDWRTGFLSNHLPQSSWWCPRPSAAASVRPAWLRGRQLASRPASRLAVTMPSCLATYVCVSLLTCKGTNQS